MVNYWILVGNPESWDIALKNSVWGAKDYLKSRWEKIEIGDFLFFYNTYPIKSIVGYGIVKNKHIGKKPLWEGETKEIIFPYRISFEEKIGNRKIKISPYEPV